MHHLYPLGKGDPLCPLGFHPQVRWPTRCKRCFRDYKEHGGRKRDDSNRLRRDDTTASSPILSWSARESDAEKRRSWVSSSNLAYDGDKNSSSSDGEQPPSSWISTPNLANLEDDTQPVTTVSIKLPKRKQKPIEAGSRTDSFTETKSKSTLFNTNDSLATRAKKLQSIKEKSERGKRIQIKEVKTISEEPTNNDVQFLIQVKAKPLLEDQTDGSENDDDTISTAGTETTDTTLVDIDDRELRNQLDALKKELETTKAKCDRLEREKSDILLRRLAAMETTTSKTTATEVLKLQQKCNELQQQLEDYKDDKKSLSLKVKELEEELHQRPTLQSAQKVAEELKSKLLAAETLCEELMDENEDIKRELRDMAEQMDELQDNFREDQAVEYTSLKKELDQTTKNCRILSFKLRKAERKSEQLEQEKAEIDRKLKEVAGGQTTLDNLEKIKNLEQELKVSNEVALRLQKELEEANRRLEESTKTTTTKKKAPMLGSIGKAPSNEGGKVSRESLTRGGSQDDPAQLLRDLQDSLEREADLREQLKFAEEEAQNLRKKASRIEDDNESLVLQLKKMASRARSRKLSPTNMRLTPEPPNEKGEADDEDISEVKLQLELSEQEASVLRKKVEELEIDNDRLKVKMKELQEKVSSKTVVRKTHLQNDKADLIETQKLKVLEDETNDLRKKLIEKERDCERLHAELSLNQKRSKGIQKSKSLDLDQQTIDLKRQLQVIDQEATILRAKVQSLEADNEKLLTENKQLQLLRATKSTKSDKNIEKYVDQIATLELQVDESNKKIKDLEDKIRKLETPASTIKDEFKKFFNRLPKKVTTLTSRDQLKTMVTDLENEISDMILAIKTSENERIKLEDQLRKSKSNTVANKSLKDLEETKKKLESLEKELNEAKSAVETEKSKNEDLTKSLQKIKESQSKSLEEKKKLKENVEKLKGEQAKLVEEKNKLNEELNSTQNKLKSANAQLEELSNLKQQVESLKSSLEAKENEVKKLKKDMDAKEKTLSELKEKSKHVTDLEKKISAAEDQYLKYQKEKTSEIKDLERKIEQEMNNNRTKETERSQLTTKWDEERTRLFSQIEDLNSKIKNLENSIENKDKFIHQLEESLKKEREIVSKTNLKVGELKSRELNDLKDECSKTKMNLSDTIAKLETSQKAQKTLEDKLKKSELDCKNIKLSYEKKTAELEIDLQNEKKKLEVIKNNHEKEQKNHELELSTLRSKIKKLELSSETGTKKLSEIKQFQESIEKLENCLAVERRKYDSLTAKYEILEEEHVVTKAKLVMEKESLSNQLANVKNEMGDLESELKAVQETLNKKQEVWSKEKLELENKLKNATKSQNGNDLEKTRLKASLEEKQSELDQLRKEYEIMNDQLDYMRKETDELRKKLDDYQKVNKAQRNISADSSAMEKEIRQLRANINNLEKSRKTDVAECRMRYESQLSTVTAELQSLQSQVTRFKRERDTYKHMLESAQKTISDLKHNPKSLQNTKQTSLNYDELEESRTKIATLEQQISCMEDQLSDARLEASKLKTELVSERSTWEVKISELHSRVNELEEEKILNSGRTKVAGIRTRMELAWQKEREEQQRILQETATLARDLRQTLFEVERERDKERLEAKRKQEQFKKSSEEDQDENKRKITELQCDLLELRDAHAKLRTTNEKLRREKERFEKEREQLRMALNGKKRGNQQEDQRLTYIIEQIDFLKQLAPELFFSKEKESTAYTPTPPRRTKSKSRENSPALDRRESSMTPEDKKERVQYVMQKLVDAMEELRSTQRTAGDEFEKERLRHLGMRRATSSEHETGMDSQRYRRPMSNRSANNGLRRKSLSLEHTISNEQNSIWRNDDSVSSLQSLEMNSDVERWSKRDASMDSRLSGGSTQSDIALGEKKKKKGIIGKLKKLTKSRSIDDQDPGTFSPITPLNSSKPSSSTDVNETHGSKKDLKERITGMFKKSGSASRSNSLERSKTEVRPDTSSTQRPLMKKNSSNSNVTEASSSTLERKSRRS